MSTAALVPETWELTGEDARKTLLRTGRRRLLVDAFKRLRVADGFSHARSLAFMTSLVMVQGLIAIVGFASLLGEDGLSSVIVHTIRGAAPGPAGRLLTDAVAQAQHNGASHRVTALAFGLVGALVAATTAMGQLERALNRLYGVEQDRPTLQKYGLAFLLAVTVGLLDAAAFAALAFGRSIGASLNNDTISSAWNIARWPLGLVLTTAAMTMLLRWCPRRHQPSPSWLAFGSAVSVLLWTVVTVALAAFFSWSSSFGNTYGPLAGMVALLIWALLSAVAVLYGAAVAAQLEAVRAGVATPQDAEKVAESEPEAPAGNEKNQDNGRDALAGSLTS
jgi:YihY family inner membrane protein